MCWHSYGWHWERDPERTSELANTDDLRIADADRERAIALLSKHAGDGRLTLEEFESRVEDVYAAKTNADLRPVFSGLPSDEAPLRRRPSQARPHAAVGEILRPLAVLALFVVAAVAFGAWVLFIGLWFVVPRLLWGRRRHYHRVDHETPHRTRDEELTIV
jgi:hypothetical protein